MTGWRASSPGMGSAKSLSGSSDPLQAEEEGSDKKNNHTSPEKKKVTRKPLFIESVILGQACPYTRVNVAVILR